MTAKKLRQKLRSPAAARTGHPSVYPDNKGRGRPPDAFMSMLRRFVGSRGRAFASDGGARCRPVAQGQTCRFFGGSRPSYLLNPAASVISRGALLSGISTTRPRHRAEALVFPSHLPPQRPQPYRGWRSWQTGRGVTPIFSNPRRQRACGPPAVLAWPTIRSFFPSGCPHGRGGYGKRNKVRHKCPGRARERRKKIGIWTHVLGG